MTPVVSIAPLLLVYLSSGDGGAGLRFSGRLLPDPLQHRTGPVVRRPQPARSVPALSRLARPAIVSAAHSRRLPYFLGGLRIGGGLALIGAIVAEIAAGSAGRGPGLAFRIVESGYRLNIPRMFAALVLISAAGIAIFVASSVVSYFLLHRWHDSARRRET